jgi:hypothetical protein
MTLNGLVAIMDRLGIVSTAEVTEAVDVDSKNDK